MHTCKKCPNITVEESGLCLDCQAEMNGDFSRTAGKVAGLHQSSVASNGPGVDLRGAGPVSVVVTDIDMPFFSMVGFMVKWALAAIPAAIILIILFSIGMVLFRGLF